MSRRLASLGLVAATAVPVLAQWVCVPQRPICPPVYVVPCQPAAPQPPAPRISVEPATPLPQPMAKEPAPEAVRPAAGFATPSAAQPETPKPQPTITLDPVTPPKIEPLQLPAQPKPAVPNEPESVKIPPLIPRLPGTDTGLPPLSLPSPTTESTSRSSPLSAAPRPTVSVYPVDGPPPASPAAKRAIGFFNHTDRDLQLTVEGETITLPKHYQVTATVAASFRWRLEGGSERTTDVPTATPGLEIVIRK